MGNKTIEMSLERYTELIKKELVYDYMKAAPHQMEIEKRLFEAADRMTPAAADDDF